MLSGLTVRLAQALKLNKEYSSDILCTDTSDPASPSVVTRESRRRLMWAVFALDAWTGTGSEQMALLRESDIKIQLPCNERSFGLRIASVTETLGVGHVLQSLPPAVVPNKPAANMGIMAYYVRIVTLRKRVVRFVDSCLFSGLILTRTNQVYQAHRSRAAALAIRLGIFSPRRGHCVLAPRTPRLRFILARHHLCSSR